MSAAQSLSAILLTVFGLTTQALAEQKYPDVIDVEVVATGDSYRFDVTLSSPYDSQQRYADAFRILSPDGTTLGIRKLLHDHAYEQPFTRSLNRVAIPEGINQVSVQGRDQKYGWGGQSMMVPIPQR